MRDVGQQASDQFACSLGGAPVSLVGEAGRWFSIAAGDGHVVVAPREPLPARCTIRPAALFEQKRGFPDVNTVMGRLVFARGSTNSVRYKPFTLDPDRTLRALFFLVETMPHDDWPASTERWRNCETAAKALLEAADVPWDGLTDRDLDELVEYVPWPEPLEGCLLHALCQWVHDTGDCVVEIGSFRGRSTSALAMGLRAVASNALLLSIDPHIDQPHNAEHVRLALTQLGEQRRLVQFPCSSDRVSSVLRPGVASLIFVDGDHSYGQVLADYENYVDVLAPGGCMVFHDYGYGNHNGRPEANPDVRHAIDEKVMADPTLRPLLLAHTQFAFRKRVS